MGIGQINMEKAAFYKRNNRSPSPLVQKNSENEYSRNAFNSLHKMQTQNVNWGRISTILQKFTQRYTLEIIAFAVIAFVIKAAFIGMMQIDTIKESSVGLFFTAIMGAFISNIIVASIGLHLSKKLLLRPKERQNMATFQGGLCYIGFSMAISFVALVMGFGIHMIASSYESIGASFVILIGTLFAACMAAMIITQYGLILPAAAANRKYSMAIACGQVRPFWKSLFPFIFSCKAFIAVGAFIISILSLPEIISSLMIALLSPIASIYIYLMLSSAYVASGYLMNMDYDLQKDSSI